MAQLRIDPLLVTLKAPVSFAAEQYQGLRMTVERLKRTNDVRLIAVTSPSAGDGKTLTAINLAGALAHGSDARVLLIDADLRRPTVDARLGIATGTRGLVDVITDQRVSLDEILQRVDGFNLSVVTAGVARVPIHDVLRSPRFEQILQDARQRYDFIIVDTPPLLPVFDAGLIGRLVDGLFVIVAANQTPRKLLAESLAILEPSRVLGIVFNRDTQPLFGYYDSSYRRYFQRSAGAA